MTDDEEDAPPWVRLLLREQTARNIHGSLQASGIAAPLEDVRDLCNRPVEMYDGGPSPLPRE
ncbi:hypothetical protein [Kitasatospora sp. NPDC088779]|uniref:hypothetical protein n=1 Tax=unclassified Kitasatospora TaxID=2633591 RepID=UPI00343CE57D